MCALFQARPPAMVPFLVSHSFVRCPCLFSLAASLVMDPSRQNFALSVYSFGNREIASLMSSSTGSV